MAAEPQVPIPTWLPEGLLVAGRSQAPTTDCAVDACAAGHGDVVFVGGHRGEESLLCRRDPTALERPRELLPVVVADIPLQRGTAQCHRRSPPLAGLGLERDLGEERDVDAAPHRFPVLDGGGLIVELLVVRREYGAVEHRPPEAVAGTAVPLHLRPE